MQFYDVKIRESVEVADANIKKQKMVRTTTKGTKQTRYAAIAEINGRKLFKFINEATYNSLSVPEVK